MTNPAPNHPWKQSFKQEATEPFLFDHQKKIIDKDPKKCGLFLGTGGGKSRTALLLSRGKTLIVMPKTQFLDGNWQREIEKASIDGSRFYFMSKEQFKKKAASLLPVETLIIDEAHTVLGVTPNIRFKNRMPIPKTSQIFEATQKYIERTKPKRIYLCTATPARNPMAIWAAGKLLGKNWDWNAWRTMFYTKLPMPGREVWQPKKDEKSKTMLAQFTNGIGFVGRLDDWFDVPTQTHKEIKVPLTTEEQRRLKELPIEYPDPLVLIGKKHQVEQGLLMTGGQFTNKLEVIGDLLEEFGKVFVVAKYVDQVAMISAYVESLGYPAFVMTGYTQARKELIERAEKATTGAFIAQSQISTGYELPSFRCTVYASMSYSAVDYEQSKGRTLRANALNKNLYVYLIAGEIDEAVLKCMKSHTDFNEKLYAQARGLFPNKI